MQGGRGSQQKHENAELQIIGNNYFKALGVFLSVGAYERGWFWQSPLSDGGRTPGTHRGDWLESTAAISSGLMVTGEWGR